MPGHIDFINTSDHFFYFNTQSTSLVTLYGPVRRVRTVSKSLNIAMLRYCISKFENF